MRLTSPAIISNAAIVIALAISGASAGGIPGLLVAVSLYAFVVFLSFAITGRGRNFGITSRRRAVVAALLAAAVCIASAVYLPIPELPTAQPNASESSSPSVAPEDQQTDSVGGGTVVKDLSGAGSTVESGAGIASKGSNTALAVLATLPVKGRAAQTGYSRDQFGQSWSDVDHNRCDTRNDVLARDMVNETKQGSCTVLTGTLDDPYTGTVIQFQRGTSTSSRVQIDHMVALSNAWQTGAQQISANRRELLANDPLNLQAVDGPTNQQKSDGDAATWLPPNKGYRCEYVARQISVKAAYDLWVTPTEKDAISQVLSTCPDQVVYQSSLSPYSAANASAR